MCASKGFQFLKRSGKVVRTGHLYFNERRENRQTTPCFELMHWDVPSLCGKIFVWHMDTSEGVFGVVGDRMRFQLGAVHRVDFVWILFGFEYDYSYWYTYRIFIF